ncbi:MAG: hypothetical protein ACLFPQ_00500 [Candidatus Woesearchaeota archaeon]
MKTVEVFIAAIITFTFVIIILPPKYNYDSDLSNSLLDNLDRDDVFRKCVIQENTSCIEQKLSESLLGFYNYTYAVVSDPLDQGNLNLPDTKIDVYNVVISGNYTYYNPKIFKLYYWTIIE